MSPKLKSKIFAVTSACFSLVALEQTFARMEYDFFRANGQFQARRQYKADDGIEQKDEEAPATFTLKNNCHLEGLGTVSFEGNLLKIKGNAEFQDTFVNLAANLVVELIDLNIARLGGGNIQKIITQNVEIKRAGNFTTRKWNHEGGYLALARGIFKIIHFNIAPESIYNSRKGAHVFFSTLINAGKIIGDGIFEVNLSEDIDLGFIRATQQLILNLKGLRPETWQEIQKGDFGDITLTINGTEYVSVDQFFELKHHAGPKLEFAHTTESGLKWFASNAVKRGNLSQAHKDTLFYYTLEPLPEQFNPTGAPQTQVIDSAQLQATHLNKNLKSQSAQAPYGTIWSFSGISASGEPHDFKLVEIQDQYELSLEVIQKLLREDQSSQQDSYSAGNELDWLLGNSPISGYEIDSIDWLLNKTPNIQVIGCAASQTRPLLDTILDLPPLSYETSLSFSGTDDAKSQTKASLGSDVLKVSSGIGNGVDRLLFGEVPIGYLDNSLEWLLPNNNKLNLY